MVRNWDAVKYVLNSGLSYELKRLPFSTPPEKFNIAWLHLAILLFETKQLKSPFIMDIFILEKKIVLIIGAWLYIHVQNT